MSSFGSTTYDEEEQHYVHDILDETVLSGRRVRHDGTRRYQRPALEEPGRCRAMGLRPVHALVRLHQHPVVEEATGNVVKVIL